MDFTAWYIQYMGGYLGWSLSLSLDLGPYCGYSCSYGGTSKGKAIALTWANAY